MPISRAGPRCQQTSRPTFSGNTLAMMACNWFPQPASANRFEPARPLAHACAPGGPGRPVFVRDHPLPPMLHTSRRAPGVHHPRPVGDRTFLCAARRCGAVRGLLRSRPPRAGGCAPSINANWRVHRPSASWHANYPCAPNPLASAAGCCKPVRTPPAWISHSAAPRIAVGQRGGDRC